MASGRIPAAAATDSACSGRSSEVLIENNIVSTMNKVMVVKSSGAGSVVGYNYMDNVFIGNQPEWVEVGINGSHMVGGHHVLFEGNQSNNYDSDDTHGNAFAMTIFRNHLVGRAAELSRSSQCARRGPDVWVVVALVHRQRPRRAGR